MEATESAIIAQWRSEADYWQREAKRLHEHLVTSRQQYDYLPRPIIVSRESIDPELLRVCSEAKWPA